MAREAVRATQPVWVALRAPFKRGAWGVGRLWTTARKRCHSHTGDMGSGGAIFTGEKTPEPMSSPPDLVLLRSPTPFLPPLTPRPPQPAQPPVP